MRAGVMDEVNRLFKPEFLNRLDEIIVFRPLTRDNIASIADIMLSEVRKRLRAEKNVSMEVTRAAKEFLIDRGYDEKFGARPLRRTVQKYIEDLLADDILDGTIRSGDRVRVDTDGTGEGLKLSVRRSGGRVRGDTDGKGDGLKPSVRRSGSKQTDNK